MVAAANNLKPHDFHNRALQWLQEGTAGQAESTWQADSHLWAPFDKNVAAEKMGLHGTSNWWLGFQDYQMRIQDYIHRLQGKQATAPQYLVGGPLLMAWVHMGLQTNDAACM